MYVCAWVCVYHIPAVLAEVRRDVRLCGTQLHMVVSHVWVLGTEPLSPARAVSVPNCWVISSLHVHKNTFVLIKIVNHSLIVKAFWRVAQEKLGILYYLRNLYFSYKIMLWVGGTHSVARIKVQVHRTYCVVFDICGVQLLSSHGWSELTVQGDCFLPLH